jgi:hypothetical protein
MEEAGTYAKGWHVSR